MNSVPLKNKVRDSPIGGLDSNAELSPSSKREDNSSAEIELDLRFRYTRFIERLDLGL